MKRKHSRPAIGQGQFDLRLTPSCEGEYNALNDPHANYYFVSSAAKQRLKDLKREIKREKHKKSNQEVEMLKMIKEKIKFQFPKIKLPQVNQKAGEGIVKSSRQHSFENMSIKLVESDKKYTHSHSRQEVPLSDMKKSISSLNKRASLTKNSINHDDFIHFLAEKKSKLFDESQP